MIPIDGGFIIGLIGRFYCQRTSFRRSYVLIMSTQTGTVSFKTFITLFKSVYILASCFNFPGKHSLSIGIFGLLRSVRNLVLIGSPVRNSQSVAVIVAACILVYISLSLGAGIYTSSS